MDESSDCDDLEPLQWNIDGEVAEDQRAGALKLSMRGAQHAPCMTFPKRSFAGRWYLAGCMAEARVNTFCSISKLY